MYLGFAILIEIAINCSCSADLHNAITIDHCSNAQMNVADDKSSALTSGGLLMDEKYQQAVWNGTVKMPNVDTFGASGFVFRGNAQGIISDLPITLNLMDSSESQLVYDYLTKMNLQREIIVLAIVPSSVDDRGPFSKMIAHLGNHDRVGVIRSQSPNVQNFYMIPFVAGKPLPPDMLNIVGANEQLSYYVPDFFLLAIVSNIVLVSASRNPYSSQQPSVIAHKMTEMRQAIWCGTVKMTNVQTFEGMGFVFNGNAQSIITELPATLSIMDSSKSQMVYEYLAKVYSRYEIIVLSIIPCSSNDSAPLAKLIADLDQLDQVGVVRSPQSSVVQIFYVIPCAAGKLLPPEMLNIVGENQQLSYDVPNFLMLVSVTRNPAPVTNHVAVKLSESPVNVGPQPIKNERDDDRLPLRVKAENDASVVESSQDAEHKYRALI